MESEEYMNRKQQEAEIAEVSILIIILVVDISESAVHRRESAPFAVAKIYRSILLVIQLHDTACI